ncbi:uncharacterized protein LOC133034432 [Cannabis sativa]|uniref:uncharacterized protein LOC133034432 n=1 Tax=Cannabis sativa TaxID=3483 RepID=UPI0029CAA294|nr:uncharacterized protein LOC133034432 [Cannabis sativa]
MRKLGEKEDFLCHDRCLELKLNHLAFANDVLLFCHGDTKSVSYMLQALKLFSLKLGLHPNASKTVIYCSNMHEDSVKQLMQVSGFLRQTLPFTYLPYLCKENGLRVGAQETFLTGRITLLNSVLIAIQAYWSQMLIMPKKVIKSIEAICRAFLWKGQALFHGAGAVAWENICQPKNAGGLGIKKLEEWNKVAIYFQRGKYTIAAGYKLLSPAATGLNWCKEVWARLNTPKHSVTLRLAMLNRLKTKDRLVKFGMQVNERCCLCDAQALTSQHLFFECNVALRGLLEIKAWLNWNAATISLPQLLRWIAKAKISKFQKLVYDAAIAALVYSIWRLRNAIIWQDFSLNSSSLIEETKWSVKMRIAMFLPKKIKDVDKDWLNVL